MAILEQGVGVVILGRGVGVWPFWGRAKSADISVLSLAIYTKLFLYTLRLVSQSRIPSKPFTNPAIRSLSRAFPLCSEKRLLFTFSTVSNIFSK